MSSFKILEIMIYLHLKKVHCLKSVTPKATDHPTLGGPETMNQSIRYVCTKPCLIILKSPEKSLTHAIKKKKITEKC